MRATCVTGMRSVSGSNGCFPMYGIDREHVVRRKQPGVAVGRRSSPPRRSRCSGCRRCGSRPPPAASSRLQALRERARDGVGRAAGRQRHDDPAAGAPGNPAPQQMPRTARPARPASHLSSSPPARLRARQFTYSAGRNTMVFHRGGDHHHADPRRAGAAGRRRVAVPVPHPGAVRRRATSTCRRRSRRSRRSSRRASRKWARRWRRSTASRAAGSSRPPAAWRPRSSAMNEVYAKSGQPFYEVLKNEADEPRASRRRAPTA